jgi:membrane-anchored protein YejM (alkaline phosphatase superfamily)
MNTATLRSVGWYCLANAVVFKLTALRYGELIPPARAPDVLLYRLLVDLSHWLLLALLFIGAPVLVLIALRRSRATVRMAAVLLASAATILLLVDSLIFTQYRMHLGSYVWVLLFGGSGFETFYSVSNTAWLTAALVSLLVIGMQWLLAGECSRLGENRVRYRPGAWIASVWALALLATQSWHVWADATYHVRITAQTNFYPFFQPRTAKRLLRSLDLLDSASARPAGWRQLNSEERPLRYPLQELRCAPQAPPNILLVVIDAWRADQLNPLTTPSLHAFARDATVFSRHISTSNTTRFGMFALFYGLTGNDWFPILRTHTPPVLMQEVVAQGHDLAILASAPLVQPEFDRTIFSGIGNLRVRTPGDAPYLRDRQITADMIEFLGQRTPGSGPFFGFLWYNSAHAFAFPTDEVEPFQPSSRAINYVALNARTDPTPYFNRYRNALHFIDGEVGRVLGALSATGELDDTLILITGDHGQEFNDTGRNYWGHNSNFSPYQVHVPMIARWREWPAQTMHHLTSHYDVPATLLTEALGCITSPQAYGHGVPLMQATDRPTFVPVFDYDQMGVYQEDRITLLSRFGGGPEVYSHDYEPLDIPADAGVMAQVTRQLVRFSRRPDLRMVDTAHGQ